MARHAAPAIGVTDQAALALDDARRWLSLRGRHRLEAGVAYQTAFPSP